MHAAGAALHGRHEARGSGELRGELCHVRWEEWENSQGNDGDIWDIYGNMWEYMGNTWEMMEIYIYGIIMGVEVRQLEFEHPKLVWHDEDTTLMGLGMRAGNCAVEFLIIFEAVIWGRYEALCFE